MFLRLGWAPGRANVFSTFFLKIEHTVCLSYLSDLHIEEKLHVELYSSPCLKILVGMLLVAEISSLLCLKRGHLNGFKLQSSLVYRSSTYIKVTLIREIKLLGPVVVCPTYLFWCPVLLNSTAIFSLIDILRFLHCR